LAQTGTSSLTMGNAPMTEVCSKPAPDAPLSRRPSKLQSASCRNIKSSDLIAEEMLRRASRSVSGVNLEVIENALGEIPDPDLNKKKWHNERRVSKQLELVKTLSKENVGVNGDVYRERPSVHGTWSRPYTVPNVGYERKPSRRGSVMFRP
jgi:hypothetical protein